GFAAVAALGLTLSIVSGSPWLQVLLYVGTCGMAVWAPSPRHSFAVLVTVELAIAVIGLTKGYAYWLIGVECGATLIGSGVVFAMRQSSWLIQELRATREALAASAVEQERLRFSRDLHDLLGQTLTLIVV